MKEIKELKFEELTTEQKLGMTIVPFLHDKAVNDEFVFEMIKKRAVGAVWIQQGGNDVEEQIKKVREATDYPILIITDTDSEISDDEEEAFHSINRDSVYTKTDDGVPVTVSRDGNHYFIIVTKQETDLCGGQIDVDTFSGDWHDPKRIVKKIEELFPNARYKLIHEFPSPGEMFSSLTNSLGYDELVIMTFTEALASTGPEFLTHRIVNLIKAMQVTDRVSTLIHFGNPFVLEELPHIKRVIFGGHAAESVDTVLEVLAGEYTANGVPTYDFRLQ